MSQLTEEEKAFIARIKAGDREAVRQLSGQPSPVTTNDELEQVVQDLLPVLIRLKDR